MLKISVVTLFVTFLTFSSGFPTAEESVTHRRIIGGSNASPGEFKYQVSLRSLTNIHFCGGSLISYRTVLTAAHCIFGRVSSNIRIFAGTIYLNSGGVSYAVLRVTYHPNYNPNQLINDIGVVISSSNIASSSTVGIIPLGITTIGGGVPAIVTGWGSTSYPGSAPNNLQKLRVNTLSLTQCQSALSGIGTINSNHICTLTRVGEGTCSGDSGGPLANIYLIGVVSWGYPCARGYPDVFTRVSVYNNWIASSMI